MECSHLWKLIELVQWRDGGIAGEHECVFCGERCLFGPGEPWPRTV